jgi:type II secretory pathway pseudopilin PulG
MKNNSGFALVEIMIYLALFGLLFSGLFCAAMIIAQNVGRNDGQIMLAQEGAFLLAKIEMEKDVSSIKAENGILKINGTALNNSRTSAGNLEFQNLGNGLMRASFVLDARTDQGSIISREFFTTYFLPK